VGAQYHVAVKAKWAAVEPQRVTLLLACGHPMDVGRAIYDTYIARAGYGVAGFPCHTCPGVTGDDAARQQGR
jgi:hypothetical protein